MDEHDEVDAIGVADGLSEREAEDLVLRLIADHAEALLRLARRYSISPEDAEDAYQRSLEILMRHARRLDPALAHRWLYTVVKHEALAVNKARRRLVGREEVDLDRHAATERSPEEVVLSFERVERSAAALRQLKPHELRALWLKAQGHSYAEIGAMNAWTYTKVNRCITEGRKRFMDRYAGLETGEECERLAPTLSAFVDGEASPAAVGELRAHLRACGTCRATVRHLHETAQPLAVVFPVAGLMLADVAEPVSHVFVRLYESVVLAVNERAANSLLRAQAVVEAVSGAKMATVAASAVAMTGSGLAVQQAVDAPRGLRGGEVARQHAAPGGSASTATTADRPSAAERARARAAGAADAPSRASADGDGPAMGSTRTASGAGDDATSGRSRTIADRSSADATEADGAPAAAGTGAATEATGSAASTTATNEFELEG